MLKNRDSVNMHLAYMIIYVFVSNMLKEIPTSEESSDFGQDIIPNQLHKYDIDRGIFNDFSEDIGTTPSLFDMNVILNNIIPELDF
jgi:ADP-glucose pyrophosphorylase